MIGYSSSQLNGRVLMTKAQNWFHLTEQAGNLEQDELQALKHKNTEEPGSKSIHMRVVKCASDFEWEKLLAITYVC
jgi:hypothetical protein